MSQHSNRERSCASISALHAEGRHIDAEWERLKLMGARKEATAEDLASHRLFFFLGALSIWQVIQDAEDEVVGDQLQAELEGFLREMEAMGHITLSTDDAEAGGSRGGRQSLH